MPEELNRKKRVRRIRHKGRFSQIGIYLGKQLRFFVNQSDWKVIPMAAIIAGLVGMVIRKRFFINMEGSLMGAFALTCVAIWNGCFNSIQSVCRERAIIKREHRSGMHITSYVTAHMIYQFALCLLQTGVSIYVLKIVGVQFPDEGFMTPYMMLDIGITMLLISYAADMMSLFISSLSHTTTGAMTVMPFVLIFQLVFSGGIIPLPEWSRSLSNYTISNYGIRALAAQSDYNGRPMVTAWNTLNGLRDNEIGGTYTVGQLLDLTDAPGLQKYRDTVIIKSFTVGEIMDIINSADETFHFREEVITRPISFRQITDFILTSESLKKVRDYDILTIFGQESGITIGSILTQLSEDESARDLMDAEIGTTVTVGELMDILEVEKLAEAASTEQVNPSVTLGQILDFVKSNKGLQTLRDRSFTLKTTVGELIDIVGEEKVRTLIEKKTAAAAYKEEYAQTRVNIVSNWVVLCFFALFFALVSVIFLEFIDKDRR